MASPDNDWLIVGSGLFGSVFAHEMRKAGKKCLVLEKRSHLGGALHCPELHGIRVHRYGPHIVHTDDREIWEYLRRLVPMDPFVNSPLACHKGRIFNLPFNMNTFNQLWGVCTPEHAMAVIEEQRAEYEEVEAVNLEQRALQIVGKDIFNMFIKGYTEKQWGRPASELPPQIIERVPLRFTYDNNYYDHRYQGIPEGGYDRLIEKLLKGVQVIRNVDYLKDRRKWTDLAERILFTGPIDAFFDHCLGELEYRSLRFEDERMEKTSFQGNAIVNYTEKEIPFTRIIEHKHFKRENNLDHTVITREYPQAYDRTREPYYPVNDERNNALYRRYQKLAYAESPNVTFGGRLGEYRYLDMDKTIERALRLSNDLLAGVPGGCSH